ncbi:MAG: hypothetical protein HOK61_04695 [Alphaproteobacteria bacterium]|jgi:hypothetical protein|nr:hypothetical protein [Alphaproteobacteria bacterium]
MINRSPLSGRQRLVFGVLALGAFVVSCAVFALPGTSHADDTMAHLNIQITDIRHERDGQRREFHHVRQIVESGGVDARLTMGKVCFSDGNCNVQPVNYVIPANGTLKLKDQYLLSLTEQEFFVFTYTGRDENGNDISLEFTLVVNDDRLEMQE